jgi:hypothetical protein
VKIGNQNAGVINNVEGTQNVNAPQHGRYGHLPPDVRRALQELGTNLDNVQLPPSARARAQAEVHQVQEEMARPEPNRQQVVRHLTGLATILNSAAAVGTAVVSMVNPLVALSQWLGAAAAPLLPLLRL